MILAGFVPDVVRKFGQHRLDYPPAVHIHAATCVSWLFLLTDQMLPIRRGSVALHRRLGLFGAGLAVIVVLTGLVASCVVENMILGTPRADPAFLGILPVALSNVACLATAGLLLRGDAAAHQRLLPLATLAPLQAGFVPRWGPTMTAAYGHGFVGRCLSDHFGVSLFVAGLGAYDLVTRRRLQPAFVPGALSILGWHDVAEWRYVSHCWKPVALAPLGHPSRRKTCERRRDAALESSARPLRHDRHSRRANTLRFAGASRASHERRRRASTPRCLAAPRSGRAACPVEWRRRAIESPPRSAIECVSRGHCRSGTLVARIAPLERDAA